jgi:cbb3-type cytochrome oxidase subunit 3
VRESLLPPGRIDGLAAASSASPTPSTATERGDSGSTTAIAIGVAVGVVALLLGSLFIWWCLRRQRRRHAFDEAVTSNAPTGADRYDTARHEMAYAGTPVAAVTPFSLGAPASAPTTVTGSASVRAQESRSMRIPPSPPASSNPISVAASTPPSTENTVASLEARLRQLEAQLQQPPPAYAPSTSSDSRARVEDEAEATREALARVRSMVGPSTTSLPQRGGAGGEDSMVGSGAKGWEPY